MNLTRFLIKSPIFPLSLILATVISCLLFFPRGWFRQEVPDGKIPTIYIDSDCYYWEIPDQSEFITADFQFVPAGNTRDTIFSKSALRLRGNSSRSFPKKSYRIKFPHTQHVPGLRDSKDFVLISNYMDPTLVRNATAYKIAELLEMPFANIPLPVNVVLNGRFLGSYLLTNKVGLNAGSVDVNPQEGILWEFDNKFDGKFAFTSITTGLPAMVKDPDFFKTTENDSAAATAKWRFWQNDLESAFTTINQGDWREVIDARQFIDYFIVQSLAYNGDIYWPKSVYMYKESPAGKYKLGPLWDFDIAFGLTDSGEVRFMHPLWQIYQAFAPIFEDEEFLALYGDTLEDFYENKLPRLMEFIDGYAASISESALTDASLWQSSKRKFLPWSPPDSASFSNDIEQLKAWIVRRIDTMRKSPNFSLYE